MKKLILVVCMLIGLISYANNVDFSTTNASAENLHSNSDIISDSVLAQVTVASVPWQIHIDPGIDFQSTGNATLYKVTAAHNQHLINYLSVNQEKFNFVKMKKENSLANLNNTAVETYEFKNLAIQLKSPEYTVVSTQGTKNETYAGKNYANLRNAYKAISKMQTHIDPGITDLCLSNCARRAVEGENIG